MTHNLFFYSRALLAALKVTGTGVELFLKGVGMNKKKSTPVHSVAAASARG